METNHTAHNSLRKEVVDAYFSLKMTEARIEGDEEYLKFLEASHRLWLENRSLHVKLAATIAHWDQATCLLNESVITQNLYVPPGPVKQIYTSLVHTPSKSAAEAIVMLVFSTMLLVAVLLMALLGDHTETWIGVAMMSLTWSYSLRQAQLYWFGR